MKRIVFAIVSFAVGVFLMGVAMAGAIKSDVPLFVWAGMFAIGAFIVMSVVIITDPIGRHR